MAKEKWKLTKEDIEQMAALYADGAPDIYIARHFHIHHSTVIYHKRKHKFQRGVKVTISSKRYVSYDTKNLPTPEWKKKPKCYADYVREAKEREARQRFINVPDILQLLK